MAVRNAEFFEAGSIAVSYDPLADPLDARLMKFICDSWILFLSVTFVSRNDNDTVEIMIQRFSGHKNSTSQKYFSLQQTDIFVSFQSLKI